MDCPYCGQAMEDGYLQSTSPFVWSRELKTILIRADEEGDFLACNAGWPGWSDPRYLSTQYCRQCNLLLATPPKDPPKSPLDLLKRRYRARKARKENT